MEEREDCLVPFEGSFVLACALPEVLVALEREEEGLGSGLGGAFRLERFEGRLAGEGLETGRGLEFGQGPS